MKLQLFSPAKINLRLKVCGRRGDGFHLLSMLNTTVAWGDDIEIVWEDGADLSLTVTSDVALPEGFAGTESNLAARAVREFLRSFQLRASVKIGLHKRIPVGGGLGGGSSNAGTILRALAKQFLGGPEGQLEPRMRERLYALASALGADVPFFLENGPARVTGIGEVVEPLAGNIFQDAEIYLVLPPFGTDTKKVYRDYRQCYPELDAESDTALSGWVSELGSSRQGAPPAWRSVRRLVENDLSDVVFRSYPALAALFSALRDVHGLELGLSGSGSTIFLLPNELRAIDRVLEERLYKVAKQHSAVVKRVKLLSVPI